MIIGENIRRIRKEKGYTQKQLAEKCNMYESQIRKYELGKANPKFETIKKISTALGIYIGELLGENFSEYKEQIINDFSNNLTDALENATITTHTLYGDYEKEARMNDFFEMLNDAGQDKAIEQVELLTKIPEYQKEE